MKKINGHYPQCKNYHGKHMLSIIHISIHRQGTLLGQDLRQQKNQPLLIQCSRPSRDSQEPKPTKKIQFLQWLFQKIPFLYFFLHKSWIWRTLGHVMNIFSYWHFHNASKEYFWSKKFQISCTGSKVPFWQFFIFSKMALLNQCMKFEFFFDQKYSSEA